MSNQASIYYKPQLQNEMHHDYCKNDVYQRADSKQSGLLSSLLIPAQMRRLQSSASIITQARSISNGEASVADSFVLPIFHLSVNLDDALHHLVVELCLKLRTHFFRMLIVVLQQQISSQVAVGWARGKLLRALHL
ncbi:hypothetical protein FGO68_gene409 [Halteria grandinella]|uniref:Uncharacterized protein n=1 Tax=Halteria grandinella TaxID=5974 RepID=A0A8J8NIQ8_HALGN|nr:hypothetical protein FGO68_gene409 [Halteria grandinella]